MIKTIQVFLELVLKFIGIYEQKKSESIKEEHEKEYEKISSDSTDAWKSFGVRVEGGNQATTDNTKTSS